MRTVRLTLAMLVLAGCSVSTGPVDDELAQNVRKWEKRGPSAYSFDYQAICFCLESVVRPVRISVRDEKVVEVVFRDTQEAVAVEARDDYPTVEGLFEIIRDAIARDAHSIDVEYDALFGYPTDVWIDYLEHAVDEEFGFRASDLTVIE